MKVMDPVCAMTCDSETALDKLEYKGNTYYFCAPGCKTAFQRNPEGYVGRESGGAERTQSE